MHTATPDLKMLRGLIVRAAGGDDRLAGVAIAGQDWTDPIHATICAMRDARRWRADEAMARRHWARRGIAWRAAGEERP